MRGSVGLFIVSILLTICLSTCSGQQVRECLDYRDNCTACKSTSDAFDCAFCTTPYAVGCFNSTFAYACTAVGGTDDCNAVGTNCSKIYDCQDCSAASWCTWCKTSASGYCFENTGSFLCNGIGGSFVTTCPAESSTKPSSQSSVIPSSSAGPTPSNDFATVDPNGRCEQFAGSNCQGTVFYNVYANATNDQTKMASGAGFLLSFSTIPGVTSACRDVAIKLTCGGYYQSCTTIADGAVSVPVPPCRSLCEQVNTECANILGPNNLLLDCEEIDASVGVSHYPEKFRTYQYKSQDYQVTCNDMVPTGWYPNLIVNSGFEVWNSDETVAVGWNATQDGAYEREIDLINNLNSTVLLIQGDGTFKAAVQQISLNRTAILPMRLSGWSKAENVDVDKPSDYSIRVIMRSRGNSSEISANFTGGSHSYLSTTLEFTPPFQVEDVTVIVQLEGSGDAYFDNVVFQEKVPESSSEVTCPFPYENFPESVVNEGDSPCQFRCPIIVVWDHPSTFWANFPMVSTVSWISWIGTTLVMLTFAFFPERRKFPDRLVLYFVGSLWVIAFRGVVLSFYQPTSYLCKNAYTPADSHDSICAFSAYTLQFAAIGTMGWWLCIVIATYVLIVFSIKRKDWSWIEKWMHLVIWSVALITMIIPGAMGKYAGGLAASMCWIVTDDNSWWQFSMFYIPLGIVIALGTPMLVHACWLIYGVTRRSNSDSSKKKMKTAYIKLILFLCLIFLNLVFLFSYKFYTFAVTDKLLDLFAEEVVCRAKGGGDACMGPRINAFTLLLNNFFFNSAGLFASIFFISQWRNRKLWVQWIKNNPRFASAFSTLPGSTTSRGKSSADRNSVESVNIELSPRGDGDDTLVYQTRNPFQRSPSSLVLSETGHSVEQSDSMEPASSGMANRSSTDDVSHS